MRLWVAVLIGVSVCVFVLWPVMLHERGSEPGGKAHGKRGARNRNRKVVGCIPVMNGKVFLMNGRSHHKMIFPKGGVDNGEEPYYAAGKEALEEIGVIGRIDTTPISRESGIDWYILEVTRVLNDWKERHERIRKEMTVEDALLHSEVRAVTKVVLKEAIVAESKRKHPRLVKSSIIAEKASAEAGGSRRKRNLGVSHG